MHSLRITKMTHKIAIRKIETSNISRDSTRVEIEFKILVRNMFHVIDIRFELNFSFSIDQLPPNLRKGKT